MNQTLLGTCPFCDSTDQGRVCAGCGRDRTATRRICSKCGGLTPSADPACCRCSAVHRSELRWKIPVIIAMFAAAILAGIAIQIGFD